MTSDGSSVVQSGRHFLDRDDYKLSKFDPRYRQ